MTFSFNRLIAEHTLSLLQPAQHEDKNPNAEELLFSEDHSSATLAVTVGISRWPSPRVAMPLCYLPKVTSARKTAKLLHQASPSLVKSHHLGICHNLGTCQDLETSDCGRTVKEMLHA